MTDGFDEAPTLRDVAELRRRVRVDRHGFWFPLVIFGALTIASAPLYWAYSPIYQVAHCHVVAANVRSCAFTFHSGFAALAPGYFANGYGQWITTYWIAALVVGYGATVWFYRRRARAVGVSQRVVPAVLVGVGVLVVAVLTNELWRTNVPAFLSAGDFWSRGTASLVILSIGLLVLALLERSVGYVVFSLGFVGLALLASLYNVSNLLAGSGTPSVIDGRGAALANLVVPGLYLLLGGIVCWALQHDRRRRRREDAPE